MHNRYSSTYVLLRVCCARTCLHISWLGITSVHTRNLTSRAQYKSTLNSRIRAPDTRKCAAAIPRRVLFCTSPQEMRILSNECLLSQYCSSMSLFAAQHRTQCPFLGGVHAWASISFCTPGQPVRLLFKGGHFFLEVNRTCGCRWLVFECGSYSRVYERHWSHSSRQSSTITYRRCGSVPRSWFLPASPTGSWSHWTCSTTTRASGSRKTRRKWTSSRLWDCVQLVKEESKTIQKEITLGFSISCNFCNHLFTLL